jgi:hypothetical protein
MDKNKILDKLSKLFELAEREDEHEAQVAAQRASELMAKHQLTMADLNEHTGASSTQDAIERGRIDNDGDEQAFTKGKLEAWRMQLAAGIAQVLGGKMWYTNARTVGYRFMMVGPVDSVGAARYMYLMLSNTIHRLSRREATNRMETNAWRRSYALGMVARVCARMNEAKAQAFAQATSQALVHVSRTQELVEEEYASLGLRMSKAGSRSKRREAKAEGWRDGASIDIGDPSRARMSSGTKQLKN